MHASFSSFSAQLAVMLRVSSLWFVAATPSVFLHAENGPTTPNMFATLAGVAGSPGAIDGGGREAEFSLPQALAVDAERNVYVADSCNHTIRKITPAGVVSTVAGTAGHRGSIDGSGTAATFDRPAAVSVDAAGNIYVADQGSSTIRKISSVGMVTTLAGQANETGSNDGAGNVARFNAPAGMAVDRVGNVFVADSDNHTIRKITPTGEVSTVAGRAGEKGSEDGSSLSARFSQPQSVAVDNGGNLFVTDRANHTVRKITPAGEVSTVAGTAGASGATDGVGQTALFRNPSGVAIDSAGNLYVADSGNHTIRQIAATGEVTTIAGASQLKAGSADGEGRAALFNQPAGIAVNAWGDLYIADTGNHTIREGYVFHSAPLVTALTPSKQTLQPGQDFELSIFAIGIGPLKYQWYCAGRSIPEATNPTLTNRPISPGDNGEYSVTVTDDLGTNEKKFFVGVLAVAGQVRSEPARSAL